MDSSALAALSKICRISPNAKKKEKGHKGSTQLPDDTLRANLKDCRDKPPLRQTKAADHATWVAAFMKLANSTVTDANLDRLTTGGNAIVVGGLASSKLIESVVDILVVFDVVRDGNLQSHGHYYVPTVSNTRKKMAIAKLEEKDVLIIVVTALSFLSLPSNVWCLRDGARSPAVATWVCTQVKCGGDGAMGGLNFKPVLNGHLGKNSAEDLAFVLSSRIAGTDHTANIAKIATMADVTDAASAFERCNCEGSPCSGTAQATTELTKLCNSVKTAIQKGVVCNRIEEHDRIMDMVDFNGAATEVLSHIRVHRTYPGDMVKLLQSFDRKRVACPRQDTDAILKALHVLSQNRTLFPEVESGTYPMLVVHIVLGEQNDIGGSPMLNTLQWATANNAVCFLGLDSGTATIVFGGPADLERVLEYLRANTPVSMVQFEIGGPSTNQCQIVATSQLDKPTTPFSSSLDTLGISTGSADRIAMTTALLKSSLGLPCDAADSAGVTAVPPLIRL